MGASVFHNVMLLQNRHLVSPTDASSTTSFKPHWRALQHHFYFVFYNAQVVLRDRLQIGPS